MGIPYRGLGLITLVGTTHGNLTVVRGDPGQEGEAPLSDPHARGQYGSPSGRHDLSHRVGRHTPSVITAHSGHEGTASQVPPPPLCPA